MIRLYIDTNIYAAFKESEAGLLEKIKGDIGNKLIVFFSTAHLNDLHRDKTDQKYIDLRFMGEIVEDNFFEYNEEINTTDFWYLDPIKAYEQMNHDDNSFADFFKILTGDSESELGALDFIQGFMGSQEIDLNIDEQLKTADKETKELYDRIGLTKSKFSPKEWTEFLMKYFDMLQSDDSLIKAIRRITKKNLNVEKFDINIEALNFDSNLSNSVIGKSFLDFLEGHLEIISSETKKPISFYDRLTIGFNLINTFGFDSEKNKKVKFMNTQHDAQHCYYGANCDFIVSNDLGFRQKTKFLYSLMGISTLVYSLQEFKNLYKSVVGFGIDSILDFNNKLNYDLRNGLVVSSNIDIGNSQQNDIIKLSDRYFYHFNRIQLMKFLKDDEIQILLYRNAQQLSKKVFKKDFKSVTNNMVKVFGNDENGNSYFNDTEYEEIELHEWGGRIWKFDSLEYILMENLESNRINLYIREFK